MVKGFVKYRVSQIYKLLSPKKEKRIVILCYHSIHPSKNFASATPELFEEHLLYLKENCDVILLCELVKNIRYFGEINRPVVVITFDDGYLDNYEYAFPLLLKYKLPATFFLTTGLLEKDPVVIQRMRYLRKSDYNGIKPMEYEHIIEMLNNGMDIGSHTYSHPNLATLSKTEINKELTLSKEILEQRLDRPIVSMAYPFGLPGRHFTPLTLEIINSLGYQYAVTTLSRGIRQSDSLYNLPRFFVTGDSIENLFLKINGYWDWVGYLQEKMPVRLAKLISPKSFCP